MRKGLFALFVLMSLTPLAWANGTFTRAGISNGTSDANDPRAAVVNYTITYVELAYQSNSGMPTGAQVGQFARFDTNPHTGQSFSNFHLKLTLAGNGPGAGTYDIPIPWGFNGCGDFSLDVFTKAWPTALEKKVRFNVFGTERWIYF